MPTDDMQPSNDTNAGLPTPNMQASSDTEWITKEEAAARLDKSPRTVLAMAADGRIRSKIERDPARRNQKTTLFHAGDVERVGFEGVTTRRVVADTAPEVCKTAEKVPGAAMPTSAPMPPVCPRPWLTLDEAAAWSGLTKRWLHGQTVEYEQACADGMYEEYAASPGAIAIRDMGAGARGGRWRFHRQSLGRE